MFKNRIKGVILPMMILALLLISSSLAQVQDTRTQDNDMARQNAERWTQTLNNRLNLTDDQRTRINSILIDYQTRKNQLGTASDPQTLQSDVNRQIEGVLDDNQRTNWDAYSTTWWTEINRGTDTEIDRRSPDTDTDMEMDTDGNQDTDTNTDETDTGDEDRKLPGDDDRR